MALVRISVLYQSYPVLVACWRRRRRGAAARGKTMPVLMRMLATFSKRVSFRDIETLAKVLAWRLMNWRRAEKGDMASLSLTAVRVASLRCSSTKLRCSPLRRYMA